MGCRKNLECETKENANMKWRAMKNMNPENKNYGTWTINIIKICYNRRDSQLLKRILSISISSWFVRIAVEINFNKKIRL